MSEIKDSGATREFETGAHRDNASGKGRCDLLPLKQVAVLMGDEPVIKNISLFMETKDKAYLYEAIRESVKTLPQYKTGLPNMMIEVSHLYEDGAIKYGENNWSATCL